MGNDNLNQALDILNETYKMLDQIPNCKILDEVKTKIEAASHIINEQILEQL